jgi:hypothetical protein
MTNQNGEHELPTKVSVSNGISADTFGGKIHIEWDPDAEVTPIGQLPFFIEYLKLGNLFEPWVDACPLTYASNNAPEKVDVLGSFLLSILAGHNRYAHMTSLLSDRVNAKLLGMNKVVSDDSDRRASKKIDEAQGVHWLQQQLHHCFDPLLQEDWILDCDTTVKPLYGHQQGAEIGYNPHKPGRPSHTYHTLANIRPTTSSDCRLFLRHLAGSALIHSSPQIPAGDGSIRTPGISNGMVIRDDRSFR